MASYVSVANLAASLIGERTSLTSPDDDTTLGRAVAGVWEITRRAALRDHVWNFAVRRYALAAEDLAVPHPWSFSYPLPAECVRLVEVIDAETANDYQLEGRAILTDLGSPLYIRCLIDIAEPALWDELFVVAMAKRLAWQIGTKLAGDAWDKAAAWRDYQDSLSQAKRVDARENPPMPFEPSSWETARWDGDDVARERRGTLPPLPAPVNDTDPGDLAAQLHAGIGP